jgi:hypothetical protein
VLFHTMCTSNNSFHSWVLSNILLPYIVRGATANNGNRTRTNSTLLLVVEFVNSTTSYVASSTVASSSS